MSQINSQSTQAEECGVSKLSAEVEELKRQIRILKRECKLLEKNWDEERQERINQTKLKFGEYFEQRYIRPTYNLDIDSSRKKLDLFRKLSDLKFEYMEAAFLEDPTTTVHSESSGKTVEICAKAQHIVRRLVKLGVSY